MPPVIHHMPDSGLDPAGTRTVPTGQGPLQAAWARTTDLVHTGWCMYAVAGLLAVLLLLSLRSRRKRAKAEEAGSKAALTRVDLAVTRITGILATAVVATGAWKVFGDVLHLHPAIRLVLFFFAEAQIVAAWRRVRRHVYRHAFLGPGIWTIYGIAFGSALVAAFDADNLVEVMLRLFAAGVAAYMIAEELAEELDIYLTANPHLGTGLRKPRGRIKWALTWERILVWLRLAEPSERTVEEVDRRRRIARFARTAYRLQVLKENDAAKWRISWARWSLRRQTESGNEHLNLAGDQVALGDVRAQLALLYGAEAGTSRAAVADLSPLTPPAKAARLAIAATPFAPPTVAADDGQPSATPHATVADTDDAITHATETDTCDATETATVAATDPANMADPMAEFDRPRVRQPRPARDANPSATKLAKVLAKWPDATLSELARRTQMSERTVSRHRPAAEALNAAKGQPLMPPITLPIRAPKQTVGAALNGYHPTPEEN